MLLVQANIGNLDKQQATHKSLFKRHITQKFLSLTQRALDQESQPVDLVVWPETAYPSYIRLNSIKYTIDPLIHLVQNYSTSLITGFYDVKNENQVANAILYLDKTGQLSAPPTHKSILLAFGEYLPGAEWFPQIKKYLPMVSDFVRGPGPEVRPIDRYNIGPLICYEALFPNFTRHLANQGADFFINLTNDSWYGKTSQPYQHLYISAGRAIENRRPLIRSTNTGITTVVDYKGTPQKLSPLHEEWTYVYDVKYLNSSYKSPFQRWGFWFQHITLLLSTLLILIMVFTSSKQKQDK